MIFDELEALTSRSWWDDEGGRVIAVEDRTHVRDLYRELPWAPFPSACGDGSIHLRWAEPRRSLDVEISGGEYRWAVRTQSGRTRYKSTASSDLICAVRDLFGPRD